MKFSACDVSSCNVLSRWVLHEQKGRGLGELGVTVRLKSRREISHPMTIKAILQLSSDTAMLFFTLRQRIEKTVLSPCGAHVEPFSQSG